MAELSVSVNGGKEFSATVPDEFLQNEPVKTIRLRIRQVYHGTEYQDTCISKIYIKTKLATKPKVEASR